MCGFSPASQAVQVARRTRFRQTSRHGGMACQGRGPAVCTRMDTCKVDAERTKEEVSENDASVANVAVELATHADDDFILCDANDDSSGDVQHIVLFVSEIDDDCDPVCTAICDTSRKSVRFDLAATSLHEIQPYAEIYGAHPRSFVFDRDSHMIPAGRNGFTSGAWADEKIEERDTDDRELEEEDGGWESWLLDQDESGDESEAEFEGETPFEFTRGTCIPDLDDETGWESWLEATLGSTQDQFFCDDM